MHLLEHLHRNVKTVAMPTAMVVGALLCRPISALEELSGQMITPTLIFLMLFVTFCRVKPSQMKPSMLHVWLLLVQTVACIGVFLLLRPLDLILAQGAMVCVLAPVAMAAVVIGGMLGANVATMATYSLLCNMAVALLAPVILTFTGTGACTFAQILARIAPLLVMPFMPYCRQGVSREAGGQLIFGIFEEILNRLDEIVFYKPLTRQEIGGIVELQLADLRKRLADKQLSLAVTDAARAFIIDAGYDPIYGARPLKRFIQSKVETLIAREIIGGNHSAGDTLTVDVENGQLVLR